MLGWAGAGLCWAGAGLTGAGLCECKKLAAATYLTAILVDRGSAASTSTIPGLWGLPQHNIDSALNKLALLWGEAQCKLQAKVLV